MIEINQQSTVIEMNTRDACLIHFLLNASINIQFALTGMRAVYKLKKKFTKLTKLRLFVNFASVDHDWVVPRDTN